MKKSLLRKQSPKRKAEWPKYLKARNDFLSRTISCEFPRCWKRSRDLHHIRGRAGKLLLDEYYFLALCRKHHDWIHSHANEARKMGLLKNRHALMNIKSTAHKDTSCRKCGASIPELPKPRGNSPMNLATFTTTGYLCSCGHWNDLKRRKKVTP